MLQITPEDERMAQNVSFVLSVCEIVPFPTLFSYRFNLEIDYSNHATALTGEPSQLSSFNGKQLNQNKSLPHNSRFLRFSMFTISHF